MERKANEISANPQLAELLLKQVTSRNPSHKAIKSLQESSYQQQAVQFLIDTKTTCDIVPEGQKTPNWNNGGKKVNAYSVTLKNEKHKYTFEFFDSIANTEKNKSAVFDFYSVLACLGYYTPESFDDFCSEFGYEFENETEYIKTKSIHLACLEQDRNLRKLFTQEEIEKLSEIN